MTGWSPPSPSRELVAGLGAVYAAVFLYALLIQGSVLIAILLGILLGGAYILWRLLIAVEAIADGLHRLADEREAD